MRWIALLAFVATPALAQEIAPKDGSWTLRSQSIEPGAACDDLAIALLDGIKRTMAKPQTETFRFDDPFDPAALAIGQGRVDWTKQGPNQWQGAMMGPPDSTTSFGSLDLTVVTPEQMDAVVAINVPVMMALNPVLADFADLAQGCTLTTRGQWTFDG